MSHLDSLLRVFTEGKYVDRLNGRDTTDRDVVIAEMQARFDHLAGVPKTGSQQHISEHRA
ncbi:MAG: hypothetical protein EPN51_26605 [Mycobacterium sp.]|nr:MAG: hypothetical protein EPN51_26605 [Mycobacterium sp.]